MAGSAGKITGAILFAIGGLIVLVGGSIVALGVSDQADNEQSGPLGLGEDRDRTQDNTDKATAGVLAMAFGGVIAIGGIIAIAVGISQRTNELKTSWRAARDQRDLLVVKTGGVATEVPEADDGAVDAPARRLGRPAIVGLSAAALAFLVAIVVVGMTMGGGGGGDAPTNGPADDKPASWLGNETFDGSIPASFTLLGESYSTSTPAARAFEAPAETGRTTVTLDWTSGNGGLSNLEATVEIDTGNGWVEVARKSGASGLVLEFSNADLPEPITLDGAKLRLSVAAGGDGVTSGQTYAVLVDHYRVEA